VNETEHRANLRTHVGPKPVCDKGLPSVDRGNPRSQLGPKPSARLQADIDKGRVRKCIAAFVEDRDQVLIGALARYVQTQTGLAFSGPTIATMLKGFGFAKATTVLRSGVGVIYDRVDQLSA
jgi:hypothetical protein